MKWNLIYEYFISCSSFIQFTLILDFVTLIVVLISCLYFNWVYSDHSMVIKFKSYFKELPNDKKFFFILFSIFSSIPNKVFVNNNISKFLVTFSIFLIIVISNIFPIFILLYILFWIFVLESYFFAVFYENKVSFKKFINNRLFNGNDMFAKEYFSFFWGNMSSGGAGRSAAGVVGTIIGSLFQIARNQEKTHVRIQGQIEIETCINKVGQKPQTIKDYLDLQKNLEAHILERDTVILKFEKQVQDSVKKVLDWFSNS